jgi:hypothetical protein
MKSVGVFRFPATIDVMTPRIAVGKEWRYIWG